MNTLPSTLTASDARTNLYDMLEEVRKYLRRFTITHKGKAEAVVLPAEEVEAMEETIEILSDPKLMKQIRKGEADYRAGRYITLDQLLKKASKKTT